MLNNWLVQGLITNWLSSGIVILGGLLLAALKGTQSPLLYPILYGLGGAALILMCLLMVRRLYGVMPASIEPRIRFWLDQIGASTKTVVIPGAKFLYEATLNGKTILVAQDEKDQKYIDLRANINFSEDDNKRLATVQGGLDGIVRVMRLFLALMRVGYTGLDSPIKSVGLFKRLPITRDFNEEKFVDAFFSVEAAVNLVLTIASTPAPDKNPASD
ncbi:MAG: hypothetical protein ABL967_09525 [Bryobacteraceae bacterium]